MLDSSGDPANTARFDGALDEVRVWDAALSEATIQANINVELTSSPNLVGRWGFAEGSGTVVGDSVAPAADGSIVGAGSSWIPNAPFDIVIAPPNWNQTPRHSSAQPTRQPVSTCSRTSRSASATLTADL